MSPLIERVAEIRRSVEAGAREIDVVITRSHVLGGEWQALYDEIMAFKDACGPAHMKVILGTGDLQTLRNVGRASMVAMMAGADFIKTSTGKEAVNATLPVGLVMTRAIRELFRTDWNRGRFQTSRRPAHCEASHGVAVFDERRTWPPLAGVPVIPDRRERDAHRY